MMLDRWRSLLFLVVAFMAVCSVAARAENPGKKRGKRLSKPGLPNIIIVMTDDQGYGPLGKHGHPWIQTPNLDRLHGQSTRLTRFLVSPTCSPTRSALMTGRHPMRNGITHTILERERMTLDAVILPQVMKTAGYKSAIFGKWHLGDEEPFQPHRRGFDEVFIHGAGGIGQKYNCSCADAPGNRYFDPIVRHNGVFKQTKGFCTDVFFSAALDWIDRQRNQDHPFLAYIATNAPHGPFLAPDKNRERFEKLGFTPKTAGFYGMIENIDENMGRLLTALDRWDLDNNTILIFLSDNGMTGGGSGRPGKPLAKGYPFYNARMKGLKGSVDEGGVRVPAFFRWPGKFKAGRDIDAVTAHIDLLPTLAEIAGAKLPENQVEGRSFLGLLNGKKTQWPDRFLVNHKGRWPKGEDPRLSKWKNFSVRSQRFRLVGKDQLYDMVRDPGQSTNVAGQHPEMVQKMLDYYDDWWEKTVPLMVNESIPNSRTQPFHVLFNKQKTDIGIPLWNPAQ